MTRAVIAAVVVVVAVAIASGVRRRRSDPPTQRPGRLPAQLDRADFAHPERTWLVAAFTSPTCRICADVVAAAATLDGPDVAFVDVRFPEQRSLHERYGIDTVPVLLIADRDGVVREAFLGPVNAADLAAVTDGRDA